MGSLGLVGLDGLRLSRLWHILVLWSPVLTTPAIPVSTPASPCTPGVNPLVCHGCQALESSVQFLLSRDATEIILLPEANPWLSSHHTRLRQISWLSSHHTSLKLQVLWLSSHHRQPRQISWLSSHLLTNPHPTLWLSSHHTLTH